MLSDKQNQFDMLISALPINVVECVLNLCFQVILEKQKSNYRLNFYRILIFILFIRYKDIE